MQDTPVRSSKNNTALRWVLIAGAAAFVLIPIAAYASIRSLSVPAPSQLGSAVQVATVTQAETSWQEDDRRPGFLGVSTTGISNALRSHFGAPEGVGVLISEITEGSAAQMAGLQAGDVIVRVDGEDIDSSSDLRRAIRRAGADNSARVELVRDGSYQTYDVVLDEARSSRVAWRGRSDHWDSDDWTDEEREEFERRMEEFGERMGEWGEQFGETFGARMEAFGEAMESFGEQFGDEWAEEFERNAEEWGRRMEDWGEEFGRKMEEKYGADWQDGHHTFHFNGDFDDEEFQRHMEELEERLQEMDWSSIGVAVENALSSVDWSAMDVDIDGAIEAALDAVDGAQIHVERHRHREEPRE